MVGYVNVCFMNVRGIVLMWLLQVSSFLLPMWEVLYTLWPGPHGMVRHVLLHAPLIWCWCQSSMTAEVFRACATCKTAALSSDNWKNSQMSSILALSLPEVPAPCSFCFLQITHARVHWWSLMCGRLSTSTLPWLWRCCSQFLGCCGFALAWQYPWSVGTQTAQDCYRHVMQDGLCVAVLQIRTPTNNLPPEADKSSTWPRWFPPKQCGTDAWPFSRPVNWKEPVVCAQAQAEDLSEWNTLVATTEILKQTAVAWCGVSNMTFAWVHAANVQPSILRACSNCISWWTESSTFAWPQSSTIEGPPPPTLQLPPFVDPSTGKLQQLEEKEMVGLVYNKEVNPLPMGLPVSSEPTEPPPASEPPVEAKTPAIVSHQQMTILTKHLVLSNGALLRISFHTAWWPFRKSRFCSIYRRQLHTHVSESMWRGWVWTLFECENTFILRPSSYAAHWKVV